ncbi:MAG: response regulator transcription factor [Lachnospiraceae bacterium]|nr:response regulator transcription factor [Lachnospiraceae bacterium]
MSEVLIIDNDSKITEQEKGYLELAGLNVIIEEDGLKGIEIALNKDIALVITDIELPGADGFTVCSEILKVKDIPVVFVTERNDDIDKVKALTLGAEDYIVKPFSPPELVARVNAHIMRYRRLIGSRKGVNDIIESGDLKIDKTARLVFLKNIEKPFTNKEFDLLLFLASNPNRVFSKDELFRNIWNLESVGGNATVTVHIKKIREKIEEDTGNPKYIETIWGVGYRFRAD